MAYTAPLLLIMLFSPTFSLKIEKDYRATDFCYDDPDCEPSKWEDICRDGKNQSPIDLKSSSASEGNTILEVKQLLINNVFQEGLHRFDLKNNGHSAQINIIPNNNGAYNASRGRPTLFLADILAQEHYLQQVHFHWGPNDQIGSEHTLNNKSFPMEIHMVHFNGRYDNFSQAVNSGHSDALAVLGIFVDVDGSENPVFEPIIKGLEEIEIFDASHLVEESLLIAEFLPISAKNSGSNFFTYRGSLTTPPCLEIVNWIVFQDPIYLSAEQINKFRTIDEPDGDDMLNNYRPVQRKDDNVSVAREFRMTNANILHLPSYLVLLGSVAFLAFNKLYNASLRLQCS